MDHRMDKKTLEETVEELSLALMYLTRFQAHNEFCRYMEVAWKGYDFNTLNRLEDQELVIQPGRSKYAYLTEKGRERAREFLGRHQMPDQDLYERFEFRTIRPEEGQQAVEMERVCFPPNEACSEKMMLERIAKAPELFLTAVDRHTGRLAGFLNGLSTNECTFRDEFFTDAGLYEPKGENIMLLGLDVLPEYRRQGLARELMYQYLRRSHEDGKRMVFLTCLPSKVKMYKKMGFRDHGMGNSSWGGVRWHDMSCVINNE